MRKHQKSTTKLANNKDGPMDINHGNLYVMLLDLVFGCYRVPHAKVNGTE